MYGFINMVYFHCIFFSLVCCWFMVVLYNTCGIPLFRNTCVSRLWSANVHTAHQARNTHQRETQVSERLSLWPLQWRVHHGHPTVVGGAAVATPID